MSAGGTIAVAPVTCSSRLAEVRDLFAAKGLTADIRLGAQFVHLEGAGDRIVFVPSGATASTAVHKMGNREGGSNKWEVDAHIWGVNVDDDWGFAQFEALETLIVELQGALRVVASGRVQFTTILFANETQVLKYGEHAAFSFSFDTFIQMVPSTESLPAGPTTATAIPRVTE